ncbi:MAG TPA: tetratricopeptide repeat protein [Acidobacteriota bacterium]|nr:tetratricopeptide repeat protein [Acidobacteriota bacterium]
MLYFAAMKRAWILFFIIPLVFVACSSKQNAGKQPKTPNNPYADLKQADQLLIHKRCADAIVAYKKFVEKYPKDAGAWNSLGISHLCESQLPEALAAFKQAISLAPTFSDVHNNLGITYMEMKDYPLAKTHFLKALEDPQYAKVGPYYNLAKLTYLDGSYEESRALAKKALDLTPKEKDSAPRLMYALALEMLGRYDEAVVQYRGVLDATPDNVEACYHLASILKQQNQPCEARQYYLKVIDADPLGDLGQKSIAAVKTLSCTKPTN